VDIEKNIPLAPLTTFKVGGPARYFADATTEEEVKHAVAWAAEHSAPLFVLGGGSNLIISDQGWPGLVLKISIEGIHSSSTGKGKYFQAGAGANWDALVTCAVDENCAGVECMSGIPGTAGGTPIQNVGAYGQEVSDTISYVRVLEIANGNVIEFSNAECKFAYRSSIFNTSHRGRFIVLSVTYQLTPDGPPRIEYADLKKHFAAAEDPTLEQVREAVLAIRQSKAMLIVEGDEDSRSAGSFFKNPLVTPVEAARIEELARSRNPEQAFPRYPAEKGLVKLSAAWLVEQAGIRKGYSLGRAGTSRKHSLAIVNRGGATAQEIMALKNEIEKKVSDVWGITLQSEPVFVGFDNGAG
jgi:UDP-N-acetylmuramate dehydrogenase